MALDFKKQAFIWGENGWLDDVEPTPENTNPRLISVPGGTGHFRAIACANQCSAVLEEETRKVYISQCGQSFERVIFFDYITYKMDDLTACGMFSQKSDKYLLVASFISGSFVLPSYGNLRLWDGHECHPLFEIFKMYGFSFPYTIYIDGTPPLEDDSN